MEKDTLANVVSVAAMGLSLLDVQLILTLAVLISALILNIYRIFMIRKDKD